MVKRMRGNQWKENERKRDQELKDGKDAQLSRLCDERGVPNQRCRLPRLSRSLEGRATRGRNSSPCLGLFFSLFLLCQEVELASKVLEAMDLGLIGNVDVIY